MDKKSSNKTLYFPKVIGCTCDICGKEIKESGFVVKKTLYDYEEKRYCSEECLQKAVHEYCESLDSGFSVGQGFHIDWYKGV